MFWCNSEDFGAQSAKSGNWRVEGVLPRFMCRFCTAAAVKRQKSPKIAAVEVPRSEGPRQSSDRNPPKLPRSHCRPDQPRKQGPRQSVFSSSRRNFALFWLPYKYISWFSDPHDHIHEISPKRQPFHIPPSSHTQNHPSSNLSSFLHHFFHIFPSTHHFHPSFGGFARKRKLSRQWVFSTLMLSFSFLH